MRVANGKSGQTPQNKPIWDKESLSTVFVGGGSMGGLLTLYLAERHSGIAGVIPMAPALFTRWTGGQALPGSSALCQIHPYDPVRDGDDLTDPGSAQALPCGRTGIPVASRRTTRAFAARVRRGLRRWISAVRAHATRKRQRRIALHTTFSQDKELSGMTNSGHCLWVDSEKEQVWQRAHQFIATHV